MERMEMIGAIRDMLPQLWEQGRFEVAEEIMGGIHQDNFTGIDNETVRRVWAKLTAALKR